MVTGIVKAFKAGCPYFGQFLNSRLVVAQHLNCGSLSRRFIKNAISCEDKAKYGTM
jgi:hypothetical protein